ncbi:NAD(P)/FAD-dependent oxidoreductase [Vreelandella arcis]|uniref:Nitrite reductase (NADH) large subunit n=1 Tax=Vreelandella arcis TaxID=416873 RepID=A0A1H0GY83_9GAMM|nr:FAD-dependent oxidoreductase [Halomonas arcis]SDO11845.1 nitrite reductase (NADH) large subunit [Halomonas arcis]
METTSRCSSDDHLVIIGNGMASHRLVEILINQPQRPRAITVIGAESVPAYNRILLSPLLAGDMQHDALTLRDADWYADNGVTLCLGERVETIDRENRTLETDGGHTIRYDRLVLATGSRPTLPQVPGIDLNGVHGFRDFHDVAELEAIAQRGGHALVIGGGLLGLEAAEGLRKRGNRLSVSVLQRSGRLMNRQLDATAAGLLKQALVKRELNILTHAQLAKLEGDANGHVCAAVLNDGRRLPTDSVIIAAGITPNAELGREAGLNTDRAVMVDRYLTTSDPAIFALGECCQFEQHTYGLVEPIWHQVDVLAAILSGEANDGYREAPTATKLKVSGVALYAFGPTDPEPEHDELRYQDPQSGDYRRLLLRDGRIEGAVLYGDTRHGTWYFEQALAGTDLTPYRQALLFGAADVEVLKDQQNDTPHLSTSEAA